MYLVNINPFHSQLITLRLNVIKTAARDVVVEGSRGVEGEGTSLIGCWTSLLGSDVCALPERTQKAR